MQTAQLVIDNGILQHIKGIFRLLFCCPGNSDIGDIHII
ncbi:hypothetical protein M103_5087 [Bacteroides fragilis str. 1007-1-F |nr:hypothetical protein M103_5087 [Bacteroides fragilis str. 1007-1-F \